MSPQSIAGLAVLGTHSNSGILTFLLDQLMGLMSEVTWRDLGSWPISVNCAPNTAASSRFLGITALSPQA